MNGNADARKAALQVIESLTGQTNVLTIPVEFIGYTGSFESALLLNQLLYWKPRTKNPKGWIYKTYDEWEKEIHLSEYKVRKAANVLKDLGILETRVKKANGNPTVHYILNTQKFTESFLEYLQNRNQKGSAIEAEVVAESLTETTTEITTEITKEYKEPSAPFDSFSQDSETLFPTEESSSISSERGAKSEQSLGGSVSSVGSNIAAGSFPPGGGLSTFIISDSEPFGQVFADWCVVMEQPDAVPNKKRKAAVCSRLKEGYSIEDLKLATRGVLFSKWHMGGNEAKMIYDDLELICRDGVQVEKFRQLARTNDVKATDKKRKSDFVAGGEEKPELRYALTYSDENGKLVQEEPYYARQGSTIIEADII